MIALALVFAGGAPPQDMNFDALVTAIGACDRAVVTATIADGEKRHSRFLLDAYREQSAVAAARVDLAERRRRLRARELTTDTESGVLMASDALDERARALAERRALDRSEQDMMAYFRTQYLRQCSGKG